MSQEKGSYISLWGSTGPTGLKYKIQSVDFATPKCDILLGGQAGLGYSYYFTKHVGFTIGVGVSHYRTQAILEGGFLPDKFFTLGDYIDNDFDGHIKDYQLRVRTQNWIEYQSVKLLEIPLMLNLQKKFGDKEYFGLYLSLGAKFQLPIIADYSVVDGDDVGQAKLIVSGYYPEDNVELGYTGKELPQHGFDKIHNPSEILTDAKGKLDLKWNIAAVAEAGILISLSRRVDVSLGAFIDYGLLDINKKRDNRTLFTGPETDYVSAAENNVGNGIAYNSILNSTYATNSRYVNKISTLSYGGKIGIRIKLGKLSQQSQQQQQVYFPCDRDTVYIYKFENPPMDSILKEVLNALKEIPRYNTSLQEKTVHDDESYFPENILEKDINILFDPIYFILDRDELTPKSIADLDKKAKILNENPEITLIIYGNTCDLGNDPHNYKLGQRRAEAARNYLISKGVAQERLESSTLSRFQPERPNTDEFNRTRNRRADFKPVYQKNK